MYFMGLYFNDSLSNILQALDDFLADAIEEDLQEPVPEDEAA